MSIISRPGSPVWNYDFWLNKKRYQGPTPIALAQPKKRAANWEAAEKVKLQAAVDAGEKITAHGRQTIAAIFRDYKASLGDSDHAAATINNLDLIEGYCAGRKLSLMSEITDEVMIGLIKWRKAQRRWDRDDQPLIGNTSVNTMTKSLRRVFNWTKEIKKLRFANEPIWKLHWLAAPKGHPREMTAAEDQALADEFNEDYDRWRRFVLRSGLRLKETLLRWSEINLDTKEIVKTGKGGSPIVRPLTPEAVAILRECVGHHPVWVFTRLAERTMPAHTCNGVEHATKVKGKRYPMTRTGLNSYWKRHKLKAAEECPSLEGGRPMTIHKMRHTFATRMIRATGDIAAVQRALGHADISTTVKFYAGVDTKQVRGAMEAAEQQYPAAKPKARPEKSPRA